MRIARLLIIAFVFAGPLLAQSTRLGAEVDRRAAQVTDKVVAWRRDIHAHPELSNRETRTAELVARHLRSLGMDVRTGVAHTGVVGVLRVRAPVRSSRCAPTWTRCPSRKRWTCRSRLRSARHTTGKRSA